MIRPRDYQREKLYAAMHSLGPEAWREAYSLSKCRKIIRKIMRGVSVRDGRGRRTAQALLGPRQLAAFQDKLKAAYRAVGWGDKRTVVRIRRPMILLPRFARNDLCIFHELAHLLTPPVFAWHGRAFATIYLGLCRRHGPPDLFPKLADAFDEHRVSYWKELVSWYWREVDVADLLPAF